MKKSILHIGKKLDRNQQKHIFGGVGFGEFGCDSDIDCDAPQLRCCAGICLTFDPVYNPICFN